MKYLFALLLIACSCHLRAAQKWDHNPDPIVIKFKQLFGEFMRCKTREEQTVVHDKIDQLLEEEWATGETREPNEKERENLEHWVFEHTLVDIVIYDGLRAVIRYKLKDDPEETITRRMYHTSKGWQPAMNIRIGAGLRKGKAVELK